MAKTTVCFNCGEAASIQISNTRPPEHKRWLCHAEKCWQEWIKKFDHS